MREIWLEDGKKRWQRSRHCEMPGGKRKQTEWVAKQKIGRQTNSSKTPESKSYLITPELRHNRFETSTRDVTYSGNQILIA
jgi:hypothetical protein